MIDGKFVRQLANEFMKGNESLYAEITKPRNGIYVMDGYIMNFAFPLIIGKITVETAVYPQANKVEFYVDNEIKFTDETPPYEWQWNEFAIGWHEIKVVAYKNERTAEDEMGVWIFNI